MAYYSTFRKFEAFGHREYGTFDDFCRDVKKSLISYNTPTSSEAIIVLGYSGNGKTTWIKQFLKNHPDYEFISIDTVTRGLIQEFPKGFDPHLIHERMGKKIDFCARMGKKMIFDGRYLNLLTRCALTQTLHSNGYYVHCVDLTGDIQKMLPYRILDLCALDLGISIPHDKLDEYKNHPVYLKRYQEVMSFYQREKNACFFEQQKENGSLYYDVDHFMSPLENQDASGKANEL